MSPQSWLVLLAFALTPSCFPYALPPAKVSVGSVVAGAPVITRSGEVERPDPTLVRVGFHPLDLAESELPLDVGVGYETEFVASGELPTMQGGYVELGLYPVSAKLSEHVRLRLGAYGTLDGLVREDLPSAGFGGSLGGLFELTGRVNGAIDSVNSDGSRNTGYALGRWGIGLFASGSLREFHGNAQPGAAVGVSVRIPLLAGIVCCLSSSEASDGDHDYDHGSSDSSSSSSPPVKRTPAEPRLQRTPASPRRKE